MLDMPVCIMSVINACQDWRELGGNWKHALRIACRVRV